MKELAKNKVVFKNYEIVETFEAGIILKGFEVKAIRFGKMNLKGSYVSLRDGQMTLVGAHISAFQPANTPADYKPRRDRVLLLNAREKRKLIAYVQPSKSDKKKSFVSNYTVVPLKVYDKKGLIKVEIGLGRGLKKYDRREKIKKVEGKRRMLKAMRR